MEGSFRDIVGAIIESKEGKILLGRRSDRGSISNMSGLWHAPGGGKELGESLEEALCREVFEETGIAIASFGPSLLDSTGRGEITLRDHDGKTVTFHMRFFMYHVAHPLMSADVLLSPSEEFSELRWFTRNELSALPLVPAGRELFERIGYLPPTVVS